MPRKKQVILVGARHVQQARRIAKTAGLRWQDVTYVHRREQFLGIRDAILLLDGSGEYSFWKTVDPFKFEFPAWEMAGYFTTILIPVD